MEEILEKVSSLIKVKKVISLVKEIRRRPSFKSSKTVLAISHLAYWLYIIDEDELALEVSTLIDKISFNDDFLIWDPVRYVLILESLIYEKKNELDKLPELSIAIRSSEYVGDESTIERNKRVLTRALDGSLLYDKDIKKDQEANDIKSEIEDRFLQFRILCYMREMGGSSKYPIKYLEDEMKKEKTFLSENALLAR